MATPRAAKPVGEEVSTKVQDGFLKRFGLIIGLIALIAVNLAPTPAGLPVAGKRMLGILLFAVIVWITDSISYPASSAVILALMAFLLGISPNVSDPTKVYGTASGLTIAWGDLPTRRWRWSEGHCLSPRR